MLLNPGGLILFDDIFWTIDGSPDYRKNPEKYAEYDEDEIRSQSIRMIWEQVVPHLGYTQVELFERYQWGLAQKPLTAAAGEARAPVVLDSRSSVFERWILARRPPGQAPPQAVARRLAAGERGVALPPALPRAPDLPPVRRRLGEAPPAGQPGEEVAAAMRDQGQSPSRKRAKGCCQAGKWRRIIVALALKTRISLSERLREDWPA